MMKIYLLLALLFISVNVPAQSVTVTRNNKTMTMPDLDSLKKVTAHEVSSYLAKRPDFGDTAGRTKDIIKIISSARFISAFSNIPYNSALVKAEENFMLRNMVDKVVVVKSKRKMYLQKEGKNIVEFSVALGPKPTGQKEYEGDGKTPVGIYALDWQRHDTPNFHSFHISYPNATDIERARKKGLKPGSNIMVHGTNGKKTKKDWTNGCIALTNADMITFRKMVFQDTVIEIIE